MIFKKKFKKYNIHKYLLIFFLFMKLIFLYFYIKGNDLEIHIIKVAYYSWQMKNGGIERVFSILINFLSKEKYFSIYLITKIYKKIGEYKVPNNIKRISLKEQKIDLFEALEKEKIDILIYNYEDRLVEKLSKLNKTKVIFYNHSSFLFWIYQRHLYNFKDTVYNLYKNCKYVISIIPVENDYLFKKWGINSILMDNPVTFDYNSVVPSDLSSKNIIMIGRGNDPVKRYNLGIKAMEYIVKEIPECQMKIVSLINIYLQKLIENLNLKQNIKFTGYQEKVDIYLKNASLHILPSFSESYSQVLGEAKIFGIPSILCGLDHLTLAKGGTIIIYDDNPHTLSKEAIKILKDDEYRKKLGRQARESMKKKNNKLIAERWIKLLRLVYKGDEKIYQKLATDKIKDEEAEKILNNQLKLLQLRNPRFKHVTFEDFIYYSLS